MNKNETRVTDSTTGGQKGSKLAQVSAIPPDVLIELAEHYGTGRAKYPDKDGVPNYSKGFNWSLSFDAAMRHLLQFANGEDRDEETGSKHVIAAAWHCINLALLMETHPEKDDRWRSKVVSVKTTTCHVPTVHSYIEWQDSLGHHELSVDNSTQ